MTKLEKKAFIKSFCNSVRDATVAQVDNMPDDWNGHQLREYIADAFDSERTLRHFRPEWVRAFRRDAREVMWKR